MCGFVGLVDINNTDGKHASFMHYALNDLHRRGPDSQLQWKSDNAKVQLGFARLAIRDLSEAGNQPMQSSSNRYTIVYNGETYNTNDLCEWATIDKKNLKGHSDTEIILACIELKGIVDTIKKMDGIFAIALYDRLESKLHLVRDHAGVKPLYLGCNQFGIVFSSHYQHITSHEFFRNEPINENALANYFRFGFIQEGEGLLENTYFLPHGHITSIDLHTLTWSWVPYFELNHSRHKKTTAEELKTCYTEVVKSQLVSDVPVGCFLSGGVDSTITTGIASKCQQNITAYTIGVNDQRLDETDEASRFATYFQVNHHVHTINSNDILKALNDYIESMGEPLADYSSLVTLKVCQLAKQSLTVVLSGDGGDELFWGYPRFQKALTHASLLKLPKWQRIINIGMGKLSGRKAPFGLMDYQSFDDYYLSKQGLPGNSYWVKKLLKSNSVLKDPLLYNLAKEKGIENELDRAKQFEYDIHMQRVLLKVDRASMFHSLEVRTPMLSRKFVELSMNYTYEECMNTKEGKLPLRNLLQSMIPSHQKNSGDKKGFSPPMAEWIRKELKEVIETRIFDVPIKLNPFINKRYIQELWNEHQENKVDNSWPIWAIYSLFSWVDLKMSTYAH